ESTIDRFFQRFPQETPGEVPTLSFDEAVICLEDELQRTSKKAPLIKPGLMHFGSSGLLGGGDESGTVTPSATVSMATLSLSSSMPSTLVSSADEPSLGKEADDSLAFDSNDLADDRGEEHVIEIRECPICHQPRLNKRSDTDIITHIATCASQ